MRQRNKLKVTGIQRQLIALCTRRGMLFEIIKDVGAAQQIYEKAFVEIEPIVLEFQDQARHSYEDDEDDNEVETDDQLQFRALGDPDYQKDLTLDALLSSKTRLLPWLTMKHQIVFCLASVLYERNRARSDDLFQAAEQIRQTLMAPITKATMHLIEEVKAYECDLDLGSKLALKNVKIEMPELTGGIVSWPSKYL